MTTFNEYRKQQEELLENTLYTDAASKQAFLADDKAVMSAFMYNFVGMLIGYNIIKDKKRAKTYFKSDQKLQPNNINDDNNNMSLLVKILDDKSAFKSATTAAQITRFLVKLKQGSIDEVDVNILIGWMNGIKDNWWTKLGSHLRVIKEDFVLDKDQYKAFMSLRLRARGQLDLSKEFFEAYRGLSIDKSKVTAWDMDVMSKKTIDARLAHINGIVAKADAVVSTAATTVAAAPVAPTPVQQVQHAPDTKVVPVYKKPEPKKDWPGNGDMVRYFENGGTLEGFYKEYNSTTTDRKGAIMESLKTILTSTKDVSHVELAKFIKDNSNPKTILNTMSLVLKSYYYSNSSMTILKNVLKAQDMGLFDGIGNASNENKNWESYISTIFITAIRNIYDGKDIELLKELRAITSKFEHGQQPAYLRSGYARYINHYLRTPNVTEFARAMADMLLPNGGKYYISNHDFELDNPVIAYINKEYHIEVPVSSDAITAFIMNNKQHNYGWDFRQMLTSIYKSPPYTDEVIDGLNKIFADVINDHKVTDVGMFITGLLPFVTEKEYGVPPRQVLIDAIADHFNASPGFANTNQAMSLVKYFIGLNNSKLDKPALSIIGKLLDTDFPVIDLINGMTGNRYSYSQVDPMPGFIKLIKSDDIVRSKLSKAIFKDVSQSVSSKVYGTLFNAIQARAEWWKTLDENDQHSILNEIVVTAAKELDTVTISHRYRLGDSLMQTVLGRNKEFTYKHLSVDAKEAYIKVSTSTNSLTLVDDEFLKDINDATLQNFTVANIVHSVSHLDEQTVSTVYQRYFNSTDRRDGLLKDATSSSLTYIFKVNDVTPIFNEDETIGAINKVSAYVRSSKSKYNACNILSDINTNKYTSITPKVLLHAVSSAQELLDDTTFIGKGTNDYKENATTFQASFESLTDVDRESAQKLYDSMSLNLKRRIAESYLSNAGFSSTVEAALHGDAVIQPYDVLDKKRIKQVLKYNNVTSAETNLPAKIIKTFDSMDEYIKTVKDNGYSIKSLDDLQVEIIDKTQDELEKIAVDLHRNKRNGNHGDTTLNILRAFKVAIPKQVEGQKEWIAAHEGEEVINPMFHGTGSVGASMILRYGFAVISSGDKSVAGRLLGDGIYGSNIINKAQQYVGDHRGGNITRRYGTKGYVFKMNACLGEKGKDYKVAGDVGGRDGIRSPEWCVFTPNSQYKIYEAYEVELMSPSDMSRLLAKHPQVVTEKSFKDYLTEETGQQVNYTTYTFINGMVPTGPNPGDYDDFEKFKSPHPSITLEPNAYGPSIVVAGTAETKDFLFSNVTEFRLSEPEEYAKLVAFFK
jgi:hypothetical protein